MEDFFQAEYTVADIIYRNEENGYTIFKAKNLLVDDEMYHKELNEYIVKGNFLRIDRSDSYRSNVKWVHDKTYGFQLYAVSSIITIPSNANGIKRFLIKFCRGIGKNTASKIVKAYGVKSLDKIREGAYALTELEGIGKKKSKSIYEQVIRQDAVETLSIFLFSHGISNFNDILAIYEKMGDAALVRIKSNPYCICDCMGISKFPISDKIAISLNFPLMDMSRLSKIILYYFSKKSYMSGNMFETLSSFQNNIMSFLNSNHIPCEGINENCFKNAIKNLIDFKEIVVDTTDSGETLIYLTSLYNIETKTAEIIKKMTISDKKTNLHLENFFTNYAKKTGFIRDKLQEKAVTYALSYDFSILSGGPGTGKTQTINEIIAALEHFNPGINISLCSPTGRAAKRMSNLTGRYAYTIHRLLGITAGEEKTTIEDFTLETDYVICDESSMIDASLFYKLVKACYDCGASLLFVGDKNQLPPVGAGLPFKNLIDAGTVPTVTLEILFRQAKESQIVSNSYKILNGIKYPETLLCDTEKQDFFFLGARNTADIQNIILSAYDRLISLNTPQDDIICLTSMHKTSIGCECLNLLLQKHLNPQKGQREIKTQTGIFRVGDRVMQTVNNYDLNVFNGDVGKITEIDNDEEIITVVYEDYSPDYPCKTKNVEYSSTSFSEITLAYALTVHKSQGSEYPCVIMPINDVLVNLSRNILYTAVTRAKSRFVFVGEPDALYKGIEKTENMNRNTYLKERLRKVTT